MHMPTRATPRNLALSSRIGRAASDSDSSTSVFAQRPTVEPATEDCDSSLRSPRLLSERAAHSVASQWPSLQVRQRRLCQRTDAPSVDPPLEACLLRSDPMSAPRVSRRELEPR